MSCPPEVTAFVCALEGRGCSSYTQRSYGLGAAHFLRWLEREQVALEAVDATLFAAYVADFRRGEGDGLALGRAPRTVNHRISALAAFFTFLSEADLAGRRGRPAPLPAVALKGEHGMSGRDPPPRGRRAELRQRVPRKLPRRVEPEAARRLIDAAISWRDKALLTLLWRTGQRIGDWSERDGRHGLLGLSLGELERGSGTVVVRLKGARDEHRLPVTDDFWPLYARYVSEERGLGDPADPAWITFRRGHGAPLRYATFESQLRELASKAGVRVTAHMFRHAFAQALVEKGGLKVAQEVLGHAHLSTTAGTYARVDEQAIVAAVAQVKDLFDLEASAARNGDVAPQAGYVFDYDPATAAALDQASGGRHDPEPPR
ncbi:MAG: tyrosine-type recombinase/integrase [Actinobacteria bacterium]|nr:tyrosine-type recombinase/integrase [Actinomycetota bacterium]